MIFRGSAFFCMLSVYFSISSKTICFDLICFSELEERRQSQRKSASVVLSPVSYTHLTLPTKLEV